MGERCAERVEDGGTEGGISNLLREGIEECSGGVENVARIRCDDRLVAR